MTTAAADDDGWVKLATSDDAAVADVLILLRHAAVPPKPGHDLPALRWSVRQRRSKHVLPRHHHADANDVVVVVEAKIRKKGESSGARASPTTPLSWSGATSASGGGAIDGYEESSKPPLPTDAARSKMQVAVRSETIFKRPRKKKTLAELKEEESLLLKERRSLKNELAKLCLTVEKQRATNESLKKMKLDVQSQQKMMEATTSAASGDAIWNQHEQMNAVGDPSTIMARSVNCNNLSASQSSRPPTRSCKEQQVGSRDAAFSLPDLNIPFGDEPSSEVLYGIS